MSDEETLQEIMERLEKGDDPNELAKSGVDVETLLEALSDLSEGPEHE